MTDATAEFFDRIARPAPQPPMGNITGTLRIDLDRGKATEHWLVTIDKGKVSVSAKNAKADAVFHTDRELFDRLAVGEANAMASALRGLATIDGNTSLLISFQRLFPGPPRTGVAATATKKGARA